MISILMILNNHYEFIDESITSVINQEYKDWELLIGITRHPDNSEIYKIAKHYEKKNDKITVFHFHNITGKVNILNEMVNYCKYEYIALLDIDDVWHEKKLQIQSKYLNDYDVIGSKCIYFGHTNGNIPKIHLGDISNQPDVLVNPTFNSSFIIRKQYAQWHNCDEVKNNDMWLRLQRQNNSFYICSEILAKHRILSFR